MRYATVGPVSVRDWLENADSLHRYFFNTPRKRFMQQAQAFTSNLPTTLS